MKIIRTEHLDQQRLKDLQALETACRLHDHTSLTFPTEDGGLFFLLYDEETLLSAFSAFLTNLRRHAVYSIHTPVPPGPRSFLPLWKNC